MKDIWYTLANSDYGTHKMRFKKEMTIEEAMEQGKKYCLENQLEYIGTYSSWTIDSAEMEFRTAQ